MERDERLIQRVLEEALVTRAQLDESLAAMQEIARAGLASVSLEETLIAHHYVTREQVEALLARESEKKSSPPASSPGAIPSASVEGLDGAPIEVLEVARDPANQLGHFWRVQRVGRGSLGTVWKAWDTKRRLFVALKELKDTHRSPEIIRLLEEADKCSRLRHPNIAQVYETGGMTLSGFQTAHYVALEFIDGRTLEQVRADSVNCRQAAEWVRDVARAVDVAHSEGVLHRDIKPRNVMMTEEGRVVVCDFGLARLVDLDPLASAELSRTGRVIGTPAYMPPEQALGRVHDFSPRSDVYSMGATLYFLLTGRAPFEGKSHFEVCYRVAHEEATSPRTMDPEIPNDLEHIVTRAMQKDPLMRYDSARAMADDLDRFLDGKPIVSDDELRFSRGMAALGAGRLEEAVHMFRELAALRGDMGQGRGLVAGKDSMIHTLDEGEAGLTLAIERQPKNYDIRTQRGVIRLARAIMRSFDHADPREDCKNALADFDQAAELRPEHTLARVNRANVLLFSARYARDKGKDIGPILDLARADLTVAIQYDESFSVAFHNRGTVHFYLGMEKLKAHEDPREAFGLALEDFRVAAQLDPNDAYVYKDLGVVKVSLAKYLLVQGERPREHLAQAVEDLTRAIKINSRLHGAYFQRGMARFALKNYEEAMADWARCIELDPGRQQQVESYIKETREKLERRAARGKT